MLMDLAQGQLAIAEYLVLTTFGHESGRRQSVELWFVAEHSRVLVLSGRGDRAGWVRNIAQHPQVEVRCGRSVQAGRAHIITDPEDAARARRLITCKYQPRANTQWADAALPIVIDLN